MEKVEQLIELSKGERDDDLETVRRLIAEGVDVNAADEVPPQMLVLRTSSLLTTRRALQLSPPRDMELSTGAIQRMFDGDTSFTPTLQVSGVCRRCQLSVPLSTRRRNRRIEVGW